MKLSRREFLGFAAVTAGAVGIDAFAVEPERVTISYEHLGQRSPGGATLRLCQLSDLHLQRVGSHEQRIIQAVQQIRPDLLLLTGDAIDRADRLDVLNRFLDLLGTRSPGYAILGNWEHWARIDLAELRRVYHTHGVRLLINETVSHSHSGRTALLTGLDDATAGTPDLGHALRNTAPAPAHLLLAHSPVYRDRLPAVANRSDTLGAAAKQVDFRAFEFCCIISGHTHGGQVAVAGHPFVLPPGSGGYVSGWYRGPPLDLWVSRGLGTSVLPVRFGVPPEVTVFDWHLG